VSTPFNLLPFTQQAEIVQFALEQAQSTHTGRSSKRPIEAVDFITSSDEDPYATDEDNADTPPEVKPARVTSKVGFFSSSMSNYIDTEVRNRLV
jgi:hypothetical protein